MTNFENIEIRDIAGVGRRVAGDFVTQGSDSLFHQTARNLNAILQEATEVTLSSATPTDIALNGMESHVIVDIRSRLTNALVMQLQYTTGGPFYAANWERMQPIRATPGMRDWGSDWNLRGGTQSTGSEPSDNQSGSHVFMIPTNGAITCRLQLYGSSVTKTATAWKRVVLASAPYQHVISKTVTKQIQFSSFISTTNQPYAPGDIMGVSNNIDPDSDTGGEAFNWYKLRSVRIHADADALPEFDLLIGSTGMTPTDGQAGIGASDIGDVRNVISFRQFPSSREYPLFELGTGFTLAVADGLDITLPNDYEAGGDLGRITTITRGAFDVNTTMSVRMMLDAG